MVHIMTSIANFVALLALPKGPILSVIKELVSYIFGLGFLFKPRPPCPSFSTLPSLVPDDVLIEIFLRLPSHPTCLLRVSLVCKHWHFLITNREFISRFYASHRTPLLGLFTNSTSIPRFLTIGNPPDCVAATAFSLPDPCWQVLCCRHNRVLLVSTTWRELLVWNPMNGNKHLIQAAPSADPRYNYGRVPESNAAVLCAGSHTEHGECHTSDFFVVWAFTCIRYAYACIYSSQDGRWDLMASTPIPSELDSRPSILLRDILYWLLKSKYILAFEMATHRLYHIECPPDTHDVYRRNVHIMRSEDGGLGLAAVIKFNMHIWSWEIDDEGVTGWVLCKIIELDKFLPKEVSSFPCTHDHLARRPPVRILCVVEDDDLVFVWTKVGVFTVQLNSIKFEKVFDADVCATLYPYTGSYTGLCITGVAGC
uniref:F-box domain-containing protein n=1 Tax=Leersia perrieri TaxID=77586 RepID=A0A0D9X0J9_9ORYZ